MKLVLEKIVREEREVPRGSDDGDKVELTEIKIGDVRGYKLHFSGSKDNERGIFHCFFYNNDNNWEFLLRIDRKGISFERMVKRPNYTPDGVEYLCIAIDEERAHSKKGTLKWRESYPQLSEGWDYFYVPFGALRKDY